MYAIRIKGTSQLLSFYKEDEWECHEKIAETFYLSTEPETYEYRYIFVTENKNSVEEYIKNIQNHLEDVEDFTSDDFEVVELTIK